MQIDDLRDYHRTLREIEALWGSVEDQSGRDRLSLLIRSAEAYEKGRAQNEDRIPTRPAIPDNNGEIDDGMVAGLDYHIKFWGFASWRSATAALRACHLLMAGDLVATIIWMNRRVPWIDRTPLELAEQGDDDLQMLLDHIGRVEAGVFY